MVGLRVVFKGYSVKESKENWYERFMFGDLKNKSSEILLEDYFIKLEERQE